MKSTTATARAMTDADLAAQSGRLRREIPAAQALLDAIRREQARRKKKDHTRK